MELYAPEDELNFAKQYIALFQSSDFAEIEARMSPGTKTDQLRPTLMLMATLLPPEAPLSIKVVGVQTTLSTGGSSDTSLKLQYEFAKDWLIADVVMQRKDNVLMVKAIYFTPLAGSWEDANAFSVSGKPLLSYAILLVAIFVPAFMVISLICCFVTPIPRRKWLWCIFVFFSIGAVNLNWTSGEVDFQLLRIGLLGVGFERVNGGPYLIHTAVPLGAIMFWIRRAAWRRNVNIDSQPPATQSS